MSVKYAGYKLTVTHTMVFVADENRAAKSFLTWFVCNVQESRVRFFCYLRVVV